MQLVSCCLRLWLKEDTIILQPILDRYTARQYQYNGNVKSIYLHFAYTDYIHIQVTTEDPTIE